MKLQQLNLKPPIWNSAVLRATSILEGSLWKIILNMWKSMIKIVFSKINGWEISNKFKISNPKTNLLSWLKDQSNKDFLKDSTWSKTSNKVLPNLASRCPRNLIPILKAEEAKDHFKTVLSNQWSITAEIWSSGIALLISIKRRRNLRWELKVWMKISGRPWEKYLKNLSMRSHSILSSESKRRVMKCWKVAIQIFWISRWESWVRSRCERKQTAHINKSQKNSRNLNNFHWKSWKRWKTTWSKAKASTKTEVWCLWNLDFCYNIYHIK